MPPIFGLPPPTGPLPEATLQAGVPLPLPLPSTAGAVLDAVAGLVLGGQPTPVAAALDAWAAAGIPVAVADTSEPPPLERRVRARRAATDRTGRPQRALPGSAYAPSPAALTGDPTGAWAEPHGAERRGATSRRAPRSIPEQAPPRRAPLWPPAPQPSATGAASGSGASAGGLAILLGVLWAVAPLATRWLRVAGGPRPRPPYASRPERPG